MHKINETEFIVETLCLIREIFEDNPEMQKSLEKVLDTVSHTAPEVIGTRWMDIYQFCIVYLNDEKNPAHVKCLNIYNTRYTTYRKKYYPIQE